MFRREAIAMAIYLALPIALMLIFVGFDFLWP
jgi:hypothetical protein